MKPNRYSFWIVLIALFILGVGIIRLVANSAYYKESRKSIDRTAEIKELAQSRVAASTDTPKLISTGQKLLQEDQAEYARLYFARASDLDTNLRDTAYAWAYSIVKSVHGKLSSSDIVEVNQALARAERVDPFFKPVLEMKLVVAKQLGDTSLAQATEARLKLLYP